MLVLILVQEGKNYQNCVTPESEEDEDEDEDENDEYSDSETESGIPSAALRPAWLQKQCAWERYGFVVLRYYPKKNSICEAH